MKARVLYILLVFFVGCEIGVAAQGFDFDIIESSDQYLVVDVRFDAISFIQKMQDGLWTTDVSMPGAASIAAPGEFRLPMASLMFGVPAESTPVLTILNENNQTKNIGRVAREEFPAGRISSLMFDTGAQWHPVVSSRIGLDAVIRRQRVVQIQLFPVRYQPTSQTAQVAKTIRFRLDFGASAVRAGSDASSEDAFESLYENFLANYKSSKKWRIAATPEQSLQKVSAVGEQRIKLYLRNKDEKENYYRRR